MRSRIKLFGQLSEGEDQMNEWGSIPGATLLNQACFFPLVLRVPSEYPLDHLSQKSFENHNSSETG